MTKIQFVISFSVIIAVCSAASFAEAQSGRSRPPANPSSPPSAPAPVSPGRQTPQAPSPSSAPSLSPAQPVLQPIFTPAVTSLSRSPIPVGDITSSAVSRFQHTAEGYSYRYGNGVYGQGAATYYGPWSGSYFPGYSGYYPSYYPSSIYGLSVPTPYGGYYGGSPPYMDISGVYIQTPYVDYIPVPVYINGGYQGNQSASRLQSGDSVSHYYLDQTNRKSSKSQYRIRETESDIPTDVQQAVTDIENAWKNSNIQLLAQYVNKDAPIAVYLRGHYRYSLRPGDYLDLTRDAFRSSHTLMFKLNQTILKDKGIYLITGFHVFLDHKGVQRKVYVSYVLKQAGKQLYIIQLGADPNTLQQEK